MNDGKERLYLIEGYFLVRRYLCVKNGLDLSMNCHQQICNYDLKCEFVMLGFVIVKIYIVALDLVKYQVLY